MENGTRGPREGEAPKSKDQAPEKLQGSNINFAGLEFDYSLVLGTWGLDVFSRLENANTHRRQINFR